MTKWLIFAYITLSVALFSPLLHTGGDNACYIILAESIVKHGEMRDLQYPGEPRHTKYPIGFPLILAPFVAVFGKNLIILKCVIMLFGVGGYVFFIKLAKSILPPFYACFASLAYLLTPVLLQYKHWVLSETPYIFFSLGSIWFILQGEKNGC